MLKKKELSKYHAFDGENYINWFKKQASSCKILNSSVRQTIWYYTGYTYIYLNECLRKGQMSEESCRLRNDMLSGFDEMPPIEENIYVYRFVPLDVLNMMINSPNRMFLERGFLSTTLDPNICHTSDVLAAYEFVLRIYIPSGTKALCADVFDNRHEKEIIFPCHSRLHYIGKERSNKELRRIGIKRVYNFIFGAGG